MSSGQWKTDLKASTVPGFFQAKLHVDDVPRDTFIKLPVSRTYFTLKSVRAIACYTVMFQSELNCKGLQDYLSVLFKTFFSLYDWHIPLSLIVTFMCSTLVNWMTFDHFTDTSASLHRTGVRESCSSMDRTSGVIGSLGPSTSFTCQELGSGVERIRYICLSFLLQSSILKYLLYNVKYCIKNNV